MWATVGAMRSGRAVAARLPRHVRRIGALAAAPAGALGITPDQARGGDRPRRCRRVGHASGHPRRLKILNNGGTAADAAVAVASTLGVTDPFVAGIGGGGYFVYYDARTHRVYTIDGRETAPAADTSEPVRRSVDRAAAAVPHGRDQRPLGRRAGHADDLAAARSAVGPVHAGRRPGPGRAVAERGFRVTPDPARAGARERVPLRPVQLDQRAVPSRRQLPVVGSIMKNPDLAAHLRADRPRRASASSTAARSDATSCDTVHNLPLAPGATLVPRPGAMTLADLSHYRAPVARPPTSATAATTCTRWPPPPAAARPSASR